MQTNLKHKLDSLDLKERLNGNALFLHKFNGFSTNSTKTSFIIHIVHALLTTIFILIIIYLYLVVGSIFNIIDKKVSLTNINNLNQSIAKIEGDYTKKVSAIDADTISKLGFIKADQKSFAIRMDDAASLSFLFER